MPVNCCDTALKYSVVWTFALAELDQTYGHACNPQLAMVQHNQCRFGSSS